MEQKFKTGDEYVVWLDGKPRLIEIKSETKKTYLVYNKDSQIIFRVVKENFDKEMEIIEHIPRPDDKEMLKHLYEKLGK